MIPQPRVNQSIPSERPIHYGVGKTLHAGSALKGVLTLYPQGQSIAEHAHDWPFLSLHLAGDYLERSEAGECQMSGPAAVLHPPGSAHQNSVGSLGLQTVVLAFDPAWFKRQIGRAPARITYWHGGRIGRFGRLLARSWLDSANGYPVLLEATSQFLEQAMHSEEKYRQPAWLSYVRQRMICAPEELPSTAELAERLGLHAGWLAQAYRAYVGEGLQETLRQRRVEHAAKLLHNTDIALAEAAAAAGFCDQSHMNRAFKSVLARTPVQVRMEGTQLRELSGRQGDPSDCTIHQPATGCGCH